MVYIAADNIMSPLGYSTEDNIQSVLDYRTGLKEYSHAFNSTDPVTLSLFDRDQIQSLFEKTVGLTEEYSLFEQISILSILEANKKIQHDLSSEKTLLVLSSTKGNIEFIEDEPYRDPSLYASAKRICKIINNNNSPVIISNACISGAAAISIAKRFLLSRKYEAVIVTGADVISEFVVSGFQSLKALSPTLCKPFDKARAGLNLGEAAGTIILKNSDDVVGKVSLEAESVTNDANHISGPSRTGEGLFRAISSVTDGIDLSLIGAVSLHGTATLFNDDMESIALCRSGLERTDSYSLKGIFGHTLGAAGMIETILATRAMQRGFIPHTYGFNEPGTANPIKVSPTIIYKEYSQIIKCASGFGGCNVALRLKKN